MQIVVGKKKNGQVPVMLIPVKGSLLSPLLLKGVTRKDLTARVTEAIEEIASKLPPGVRV